MKFTKTGLLLSFYCEIISEISIPSFSVQVEWKFAPTQNTMLFLG